MEGPVMDQRVVRLLFRVKHSRTSAAARSSVKVVTNVRVAGGVRKNPVQIHVGYLSLLRPEITDGDRRKLMGNLQQKWIRYFGNDRVQIDWEHAMSRFKLCRERCISPPALPCAS